MPRPHVVILGDRVEAIKWIGYALAQFDVQVNKFTPNFATTINPQRHIAIEMKQLGGVAKVTINARPPVAPSYIGNPYDQAFYGGWGYPYAEPDDEGEYDVPVTSKNVPYGTTFGEDVEHVILDGKSKIYRQPKRFPQYKGQYVVGDVEGAEEIISLAYGTMDWVSAGGNTIITWDGTNSRHNYIVPNIDDILHGAYAGTCNDDANEGFPYLGHVFTEGPQCDTDPTPYKYDIARVQGVTEGAGQELSDYDIVPAMTGRVYKDGQVIWEAPTEGYSGSTRPVITAACLVSRVNDDDEPIQLLRVVVAKYDSYKGVLSERIMQVNMSAPDGPEVISDEGIDEYGNEDIPLNGDTSVIHRPFNNVNAGDFSGDGNKLVLLRSYYAYNESTQAYWFTPKVHEYIIEEEAPEEGDNILGGLSGISLNGGTSSSSGGATEEELWNGDTEEDTIKVTYLQDLTDDVSERHFYQEVEGDYVIAVAYDINGIPTLAFIHAKWTEKYDEVITPSGAGACELRTVHQELSVKEWMHFSWSEADELTGEFETKKDTTGETWALFHHNESIKDRTFSKDYSPSGRGVDIYPVSIDGAIGAVDPRVSSFIVTSQEVEPWRVTRVDFDEGLSYYEEVFPTPVIHKIRMLAFVGGEVYWGTEYSSTEVEYSLSLVNDTPFRCAGLWFNNVPASVGTLGFPKSMGVVPVAATQCIGVNLPNNLMDVLIVGQMPHGSFPTLGIVARIDKMADVPIIHRFLEEHLEIGEFYNGDDESNATKGCYTNVGLI